MIFWALGLLIAGSQLSVYMELASYFPNRSGAEVVYLEQGYPRPKYLLPVSFAVQSVLLSFSSSNAIGKHRHLTSGSQLTPAHSHGSISLCCRRAYAHSLGEKRPRCSMHDVHYFV